MCPPFASRRSEQAWRPLQIRRYRNGDSATIALSGELDLASRDELDRQVRDCEETDIAGIVIDLSGVSFTDAAGLSTLLQAKKRILDRLHFLPSEHKAVTRLLDVTGTAEVLV